jgi:hypothetical protein
MNSGMVVGKELLPMPSPRKVYMRGKAYGKEDEAPELDIHLLGGPKNKKRSKPKKGRHSSPCWSK